MAFKPSTLDFSAQSLFKMVFTRIPNVEYYTFSVTIPGITLGEATQPTPTLDIRLPGDKLVFDPFVLTFLVQEDLQNYVEIYNWLIGLGKPVSTDQHKAFVRKGFPERTEKQNKYSDASLFVLTNKNNPAIEVVFRDIYPISLSTITFDSSVADYAVLTADVTFNYLYYEFKKKS